MSRASTRDYASMPLSWCTEEEFVEYIYEPEDEWHCIHEVLEGFLFQGNVTASMSEKVFRYHGLSGIVNVTNSMARPAHLDNPKEHYLQIEVLDCDSHASSLSEHLDDACDFLGTRLLPPARPCRCSLALHRFEANRRSCSQGTGREGTGALRSWRLEELDCDVGLPRRKGGHEPPRCMVPSLEQA